MNTILDMLLEISITASILIIAILVIRRFFREKISSRVIYCMWLLVVFRLMLPISIPSPTSVMNIINEVHNINAQVNVQHLSQFRDSNLQVGDNVNEDIAINQALNQAVNQGNGTLVGNEQSSNIENQNEKNDELQVIGIQYDFSTMLIIVWLIGIFCTASYMLFVNMRFKRLLVKSREYNGNVNTEDKTVNILLSQACKQLKIQKRMGIVVNDAIASPCFFGLLHPQILITSKTLESEKQIRHVLLHELCHYKQKDQWNALLRNICLAVYWFNPFVWLAAIASRNDGELACDEWVLNYLDKNENADYGKTLLYQVCKNKQDGSFLRLSTSMSMGGNQMKERIAYIIKRPKTKKVALGVAIGLLFLICSVTFYGAMPGKDGKDSSDLNTDTNTDVSINANADVMGYADLNAIQNSKTAYVGDASRVGGILSNLPEIRDEYNQNMMAMHTDREPYGLTVYYEYNGKGQKTGTEWMNKMENNALLLFSYIDNLEYVEFAYRETPSQGILTDEEYVERYKYRRSYITDYFGDLEEMKEDIQRFNDILVENASKIANGENNIGAEIVTVKSLGAKSTGVVELLAKSVADMYGNGVMLESQEVEWFNVFGKKGEDMKIPNARIGEHTDHTMADANTWNEIVSIGAIPEQNIWIYGNNEVAYPGQGVIIDIGEEPNVHFFPWRYMSSSPREPKYAYNEEERELYLSFTTGTGTGMSVDQCYVLKRYETEHLEPYYLSPEMIIEELNKRIRVSYDFDKSQATIYDGDDFIQEANITHKESDEPNGFFCGNFLRFDVTEEGIQVCFQVGLTTREGRELLYGDGNQNVELHSWVDITNITENKIELGEIFVTE